MKDPASCGLGNWVRGGRLGDEGFLRGHLEGWPFSQAHHICWRRMRCCPGTSQSQALEERQKNKGKKPLKCRELLGKLWA